MASRDKVVGGDEVEVDGAAEEVGGEVVEKQQPVPAKSSVNTLILDHDDDEIDLPPEFDHDAEVQGIDLDDQEITADDIAFVRELNPPAGDWVKSGRWECIQQVYTQDQMPGDRDSQGRTYFRFEGKPEPRVEAGVVYEPILSFRISPDKRRHRDKPDQYDKASELWGKAIDLFISSYSRQPKNVKELRLFLRDEGYIINTMKGDSSPMVMRLKSKSAGQRRR
jgi:hypothetical protein